MKKFTRKRRAEIYLEAAQIEQHDYQGGVTHLIEKAGVGWDFTVSFPEIIFFNKNKVDSVFTHPEIRKMRILALLLAREIALRP